MVDSPLWLYLPLFGGIRVIEAVVLAPDVLHHNREIFSSIVLAFLSAELYSRWYCTLVAVLASRVPMGDKSPHKNNTKDRCTNLVKSLPPQIIRCKMTQKTRALIW